MYSTILMDLTLWLKMTLQVLELCMFVLLYADKITRKFTIFLFLGHYSSWLRDQFCCSTSAEASNSGQLKTLLHACIVRTNKLLFCFRPYLNLKLLTHSFQPHPPKCILLYITLDHKAQRSYAWANEDSKGMGKIFNIVCRREHSPFVWQQSIANSAHHVIDRQWRL